jgi:tetratricopeptide (TPR) repeat protein
LQVRAIEMIESEFVKANGIRVHVIKVENEGPLVLFLHGFPEFWYAWRHQLAALGDIYVKIGRPEEAKKQFDLVEFIGYLNAINKVLYNRELALFYADHERNLAKALALAEKELEVRRDIYTYDVLAWTLYKNDKLQEALVAMTQALRLGTQDARLFFHAGMIYHRLGKQSAAQTYLRRALQLNPHFHPLQAGIAKLTLETLNKNSTLSTLQEKSHGHS